MTAGSSGKPTPVPPLPTQPDILPLCIPFLEYCPASIAIKDPSAHFVWGNSVLLDLAGASSLETIKGRTAEEVFQLLPSDPIIANDASVDQMKIWICVEETLPNWKPRTSIRFPILDSDERVQFIGAVGAHFQLAYDYTVAWSAKKSKPKPQPKQARTSRRKKKEILPRTE
jgi:hypothetical protein